MPNVFDPIINYYILYGPILIMVTLVLTCVYFFISNFAALRSSYYCISLKNIVTANIFKCFSSRQGPTCKTSDVGFTHGWCNDINNYGTLRGTRAGPYGVKCADWIWKAGDCPPSECANIKSDGWGWCADKDVQKAMRGQACGPYNGKCDNWIWDAKSCITKCGKSTCTDDSCICSTVKVRYIILKRINGTKEINFKSFKLYDSNGYLVKDTPRLTKWPVPLKDQAAFLTGPDKNAYVQFDFKTDIDIGRVIIESLNNDNMIGTALVLRRDNNETALYRTITEKQEVYEIKIGKASDIQFSKEVKLSDDVKTEKSIISTIANIIAPQELQRTGPLVIMHNEKCLNSKSLKFEKCEQENVEKQKIYYDADKKTLKMPSGLCLDSNNKRHIVKCSEKGANLSQQFSYDFSSKQFKSATDKCLVYRRDRIEFKKCMDADNYKFTFKTVPIEVKQIEVKQKDEALKVLSKKEQKQILEDQYREKRRLDAEKKRLEAEKILKDREEKRLIKEEVKKASAITRLKLTDIRDNTGINNSKGTWTWALNNKSNIFKCKNPCKGAWRRVDGIFTKIDIDDKEVWAINQKGEIFKRPVDGSKRWQKVSNANEKFTNLKITKDKIYALTTDKLMKACGNPCQGKWEESKDVVIF